MRHKETLLRSPARRRVASCGGKIVLNEIDPARARVEIEDFLIHSVLAAGMRGGVIGMSGGIDSSTVAALAASAFRRHNRENPGKDTLDAVGLILPSATNRPEDERDAREVARMAGINCRVIPIQPLIDAFRGAIGDLVRKRYHRGNLASEVRAVVLSRYAAATQRLVLGTGNRDEDYCLGYFTKRGDGAVDISPIGALSKRHVRQMAVHLGLPDSVITKAPTAGLWRGQTDEAELGFTYDFAENVIAGNSQGMSPTRIARALGCTLPEVDKVLARFSQNKHKTNPPAIAPVTYIRTR